MLTLNVLAPVLYCGALVMMLNVCSDDVLASTFLSLSPPARGGRAAVARAVLLGAGRGRDHVRQRTPHHHGRHHGRTGAAHAQHQLDVQNGVVPVLLRVQLRAPWMPPASCDRLAADAAVLVVVHDNARALPHAVAARIIDDV